MMVRIVGNCEEKEKNNTQVANKALKTDNIRPPKKAAFVATASGFPLSSFVTETSWACTPLNKTAY